MSEAKLRGWRWIAKMTKGVRHPPRPRKVQVGVPAMVSKVMRLLTCAALSVSWMASARAQQTEPATTETPLQQPTQIETDAAKKQQQSVEVLRQLPVDPDECILPVLVDLMEQTRHEKEVLRYVSVFDHDMDGRLQRLLRQRGLEARPNSALVRDTQGRDPYGPGGRHTDFWQFSVGAIEKASADEYGLGAGYHCGSLCFGRLRYTLKIEGTRCSIVSKVLELVS